MGVFTRRVGQKAALVGLVAGVLVTDLRQVRYADVAYTWYAVIGATTTFAAGLLAVAACGCDIGTATSQSASETLGWYDEGR